MMSGDLPHRRFLRSQRTPYQIGQPFPHQLKLHLSDEQPADVSFIRNSKWGSIVFVLSEYCEGCRLEPVIQFSQAYPEFQYVLFYESVDRDVRDLSGLKRQLPSYIHIFSCEILAIEETLQYGARIPWVFAVNRVGQIIAASHLFHAAMLEDIMEPFKRTFYPDKPPVFSVV